MASNFTVNGVDLDIIFSAGINVSSYHLPFINNNNSPIYIGDNYYYRNPLGISSFTSDPSFPNVGYKYYSNDLSVYYRPKVYLPGNNFSLTIPSTETGNSRTFTIDYSKLGASADLSSYTTKRWNLLLVGSGGDEGSYYSGFWSSGEGGGGGGGATIIISGVALKQGDTFYADNRSSNNTGYGPGCALAVVYQSIPGETYSDSISTMAGRMSGGILAIAMGGRRGHDGYSGGGWLDNGWGGTYGFSGNFSRTVPSIGSGDGGWAVITGTSVLSGYAWSAGGGGGSGGTSNRDDSAGPGQPSYSCVLSFPNGSSIIKYYCAGGGSEYGTGPGGGGGGFSPSYGMGALGLSAPTNVGKDGFITIYW